MALPAGVGFGKNVNASGHVRSRVLRAHAFEDARQHFLLPPREPVFLSDVSDSTDHQKWHNLFRQCEFARRSRIPAQKLASPKILSRPPSVTGRRRGCRENQSAWSSAERTPAPQQ